MFRTTKRDLLVSILDVTGCFRALRAVSAWRGVVVLNYHRIGDARLSSFDRNLWSASEADFDQHVAWLAKNFDVIGPGDLEHTLEDSRGRYVMITFDDGYRDNYAAAYPILIAWSWSHVLRRNRFHRPTENAVVG